MSIHFKSVLVGLAGAMLTWFFWDKIRGRRMVPGHTIEFELKAEPTGDTSIPFSFANVLMITRERLKEVDDAYQLEKTGKNTFRVIVNGVKDTVTFRQWLISSGRLEFREVYNSYELSGMLVKANEIIGQLRAPSLPSKKAEKNDSLSKPVSDLLDSLETTERKKVENASSLEIIQFSMPYSETVYSAEVGKVKPTDTAAVRTVFERDEIKKLAPPDAVLCFGWPEKYDTRSTQKHSIPLYFLRTYNKQQAILENESLADAKMDFDVYGKPVVAIIFKPSATEKWRILTKRNIGRSIAIIVNGSVISAPKVESEIGGGNAQIHGNFTLQEIVMISSQIKALRLPGSLVVLSQKIKAQSDTSERSKKLLSALGIFVLFSLACFFILKSLAPNHKAAKTA